MELELAYAITVHKSQGSEFPAVVNAYDLVPADAHDPEPAVHRRDPRQKPGSGGGLRGSDARHGGQQPNR